MTTVIAFGNPDLEFDSLPLRLVKPLKRLFPDASIMTADPNEEIQANGDITVLDTVMGIEQVTEFDGLDAFEDSPRTGMHGFDALMQLKLMKKIGKIGQIKIIGIPPTISFDKALRQTLAMLDPILS